jgi:hypothetical protein
MSVEQINKAAGAVLYLHHDQQGSTRLLTSSTGTKEAHLHLLTLRRPDRLYSPHSRSVGGDLGRALQLRGRQAAYLWRFTRTYMTPLAGGAAGVDAAMAPCSRFPGLTSAHAERQDRIRRCSPRRDHKRRAWAFLRIDELIG